VLRQALLRQEAAGRPGQRPEWRAQRRAWCLRRPVSRVLLRQAWCPLQVPLPGCRSRALLPPVWQALRPPVWRVSPLPVSRLPAWQAQQQLASGQD
jgi:hypothetical protein